MNLTLPDHDFDCLGIKEKVYTATELFSGASFELELQKDDVLELHMAPYDGIVCKIK